MLLGGVQNACKVASMKRQKDAQALEEQKHNLPLLLRQPSLLAEVPACCPDPTQLHRCLRLVDLHH